MKKIVTIKQQIIDVATELAQQYGLNAFSYQDISKIVGITKASIHHHFPTKADLSYSILERYTINFFAQLAAYEKSNLAPLELLTHYVHIFKKVATQNNKICLCFMLAMDYLNLDETIQDLIKKFYVDNEAWLANVLSLHFNQDKIDAMKHGRFLFATLQGLLVRNRIFDNSDDFDNIIKIVKLM